MSHERIFEALRDAVIEQDQVKAVAAAEDLLAQGLDPIAAVERGLAAGMKEVGDRFDRMDMFLPDLIFATDVYNAAAAVLEPEIRRRGEKRQKRGVVVIGTVKGDIHKIGKDLVAMLMRTRGFEVHDLGEDVAMSTFVDEAVARGADIIAMSALLTTTMWAQREVISLLAEKGLRERFHVMVGGAPVTKAWADEIGADGYAPAAGEAVDLAIKLAGNRETATED